MISVSVIYPNEAGKKFDIDYYCNEHIPRVQQKLGSACKRVAAEHGLLGVESYPAIWRDMITCDNRMRDLLASTSPFAHCNLNHRYSFDSLIQHPPLTLFPLAHELPSIFVAIAKALNSKLRRKG
jgi:hypothetical protein